MRRVFLPVLLAVTMGTTLFAAGPERDSLPYEFVLAKITADQGEFEEALRLMNQVIEKEPRNPVLLYERATILLEAGKIERAEEELEKLLVLTPGFYDAHKVLGRLLIDRSRGDKATLDKALIHLEEAFKLAPDDLSTGVTVAQILASSGRLAEAEKILKALLERSPDQRTLNYNYAQILVKLGRGNESRSFLERSLEGDPTFGPAVFQLVELYQDEREWLKAAAILQPIIEQDPLNLDLQRQQGFFYLRGGEAGKARDRFTSLVAADPKDDRALFYLAEALGALNEHQQADGFYRRLLEKAPNDPELLISFGLSQMGQSKFDDAARTFETVLTLPKLPENLVTLAQTELAMIDHQKKNYESALRRARELLVVRKQPNMQAINIALDVLRREKRHGEAVSLLQPLVQQFGTDPAINARYVEFLMRTGDKGKARAIAAVQARKGKRAALSVAESYSQAGAFDDAVAVLEELHRATPDDIDILFQLGSTLERSGKKIEAEKTFSTLLERRPDHTPSLNYLGYMWAERGANLDRAAEMLLKAVSSEPRNGAYLDSLGWVYFRQGKLDLAEKYLSDAVRVLPNDPTVREHLGDLFARQRNYGRALDSYAAALRLEPEDEAKVRSKIDDTEKLKKSR